MNFNSEYLFSVISKFIFIYTFSILIFLKFFLAYIDGTSSFIIIAIINLCIFLFLFIFSLINYFQNIKNLKKSIYINVFIFMYIYMFLYIIGHLLLNNNTINLAISFYQFKILVYAIFYVLIAIYFYEIISKSSIDFYYISFFVIYVIFIFIYFNNYNVKIRGAHQLIGDTFSIYGLFLMVYIQSRFYKIVFIIFLLILLLFINSRASSFSFLIVFCFFIIKELGVKNFLLLFFFSLLCLCYILYDNTFEINRGGLLGPIVGMRDDSLSERLEQYKYGIEAIKNNWLWGEYAGQINMGEEHIMGNYMHNFLSFWRQFGLPFFIVFTSTYMYAFYKIFIEWKKIKNIKTDFIFYVSLFYIIELFLFRSYSFPYFWFALGLMYAHLNSQSKK